MDKIKTIIDKEWAEVFKNKLVLFSVAFLPLMLTALPLITIYSIQGLTAEEMAASTTQGTPDEFFGDACIGLNEADCTMVYMLNIFTLMFMILPVMVPVTIAAYSIVGEKSTRSLEPLLATPITTLELILGKGIAAVLPAIGVTWISFGIYLVAARFMTNETVFARLIDPMWLLAVFLVGPLLAVLAVCAAMMVSSRVSDPRTAEQISGAVMLPIILLVMGQSFGLFLLSSELVLVTAVILIILDAVLFYLTVKMFQRETILTRWK
ncbi:MAG: ABC transporter permease [Ardenticatenaceae bacterium]|nr:ABC transporter permease [Anaerolineales bacterium]MCB8941417.1 ABC transporter permease [Ardenticatenaceae bacterium]MCB8972773.1 ABC transporter permease [Ardenticatenaceae bacterium]